MDHTIDVDEIEKESMEDDDIVLLWTGMTCDHFNTDLEIETENSSKLLKKRSSLIVLAFADPNSHAGLSGVMHHLIIHQSQLMTIVPPSAGFLVSCYLLVSSVH